MLVYLLFYILHKNDSAGLWKYVKGLLYKSYKNVAYAHKLLTYAHKVIKIKDVNKTYAQKQTGQRRI